MTFVAYFFGIHSNTRVFYATKFWEAAITHYLGPLLQIEISGTNAQLRELIGSYICIKLWEVAIHPSDKVNGGLAKPNCVRDMD